MPRWIDVEDTAGEAAALARLARQRVEATGLAMVATLRADGSPRISGLEPLFAHGELWLAMMPGSRKAADLRRDPRFALHNATVDKEVARGDAKIEGRALEVTDAASEQAFRTAFAATTGHPVPDGPMALFRADVHRVTVVRPEGDHLSIDTWSPEAGLRHMERR